ncbi:unnamed protein product, partial [Staurois parvus]
SVPPYISCPHQTAPLHQVSPSQCHLTSGIPVRVPPYTQSTPLHHISHLSAPLHHISHQSAPFHHMCQSDCPFPSQMPIRVPLNIKCAHQSVP